MDIVLVEDELVIREGLCRLLEKLNPEWRVVGEACDGAEGIDCIEQLRPDLVITDIRMPNMDGLEMLERLAGKGIETKAVMLSAYSEFAYARRAMKLGVTEYILKPIAIQELRTALDNVERQIREERLHVPRQMGSLERILYMQLTGKTEPTGEMADYLRTNYGLSVSEPLAIACAYMGPACEENLEQAKKYFRHALSLYPDVSYEMLNEPYSHSLVVFLYGYASASDLERWLQTQILHSSPKLFALGWTQCPDFAHIRPCFHDMFSYMEWNISLGNQILISYPKITNVQATYCVYPLVLEEQMRAAVCANDQEKVADTAKKFIAYFQSGAVYAPKEIKDCYVRFLWGIISLSKEVGILQGEDLDQQHLLSLIMEARSTTELSLAVDELRSAMFRQTDGSTGDVSLITRKVLRLLHEYYREGITLDEISEKLKLTPEYVGTLFKKDTGVNFSMYLRNYRIEKARKLLCTSKMKTYEIAESVGYQDAKYFSKVFKEETGQLPSEYRKSNR